MIVCEQTTKEHKLNYPKLRMLKLNRKFQH
ncbi:hypothetical protein SAMN04488128_10972 [Chitinophaga eiseniae]|uniref:Uncharacterized protein n=1 Tax=Chitinophaga eiseniae TaxID=634771 RepID=A0A1T4U588_9BACT|nr:hypothetical protein SAMN04488128_10972 [Chitinophaga eiseniae]